MGRDHVPIHVLNQPDAIKAERACSACHRRKLKCDRELPPRGCGTCQKSNIPCIYTDQGIKNIVHSTTRAGRRKPRGPYNRGQTPREKELESQLVNLSEKYADLEAQMQQAVLEPDIAKVGPLATQFHTIRSSQVESSSSIGVVHPDSAQILELWLQYVFAIDPLYKIIHCPTIALVISTAKDDPVSQSLEVQSLMLSIYIAALNSLDRSESNSSINRDKLVLTYRTALDDYLQDTVAQPNSVTLITLQAALIYLVN